ncbi:hypothetical protein IIA15_11615 [candidate division TA06 bacterium]|nr:hypothetical protein [candidate division TA06 bacterium]
MKKEKGVIEFPLEEHPKRKGTVRVSKKRGKPSVTHYTPIERFRGFTFVRVHPLSGRTHQIRVHFASLGHSLAVDALYGRRSAIFLSELKPNFKRKKDEDEKPLISRLTLHAGKLSFKNMDGHEITLEAPLPKDLTLVLKYLRKFRPLSDLPHRGFF